MIYIKGKKSERKNIINNNCPIMKLFRKLKHSTIIKKKINKS